MKTSLSVIQTDSVVISLMRASTALTEAKTIQHTKKIVDVAAAAEIYVRRQNLGEEAEKLATSIKVEALRKLGEMLKATPKATGTAGLGRPKLGGTKVEPPKDTPTLDELGIDKKTSAVAQKLAELPDAAFEQVREGNETMAKALAKAKADKDAANAKPPPSAPVLSVVAQPPETEYTELDALHDQIEGLQDALATANMGDVSDEDRGQAKTLIAELRARIKALETNLKAVTVSRDSLMVDLKQVKLQCVSLQSKIKKLEIAA